MQVVRHDHAAERAVAERKRLSGLEIELACFDAGVVLHVIDPGEIAVDGNHRMASIEEEAGVTALTTRDVEDDGSLRNQRGEALDPRRDGQVHAVIILAPVPSEVRRECMLGSPSKESPVSRLGTWQPASTEERLDRMESLAAIRQLPYRYALALDSRDMDALVELFAPDVRVGRDSAGRDALKAWFTETMRQSRTSIHQITNHVVDFDDADHAHGIVYCRDELEKPDTGQWQVGTIQYWDEYARVDSEWCFVRRKFHRWYLVDALTRPGHGAGVNEGPEPLRTIQLPEAFDSWHRFWDAARAHDT